MLRNYIVYLHDLKTCSEKIELGHHRNKKWILKPFGAEEEIYITF